MYLHASLLNIGSFEACKSLANSCGDSMPECFFASVSIDAGTALGGTSNVRKTSLSIPPKSSGGVIVFEPSSLSQFHREMHYILSNDDSILHPPLNTVQLHV